MRIKLLYIWLIIFFDLILVLPAVAQVQLYKQQFNKDSSNTVLLQDTVSRKHFGRAAGELLLFEAIPYSWDRFVKNEPYAQTTLSSWKYNLKLSSWGWDQDPFTTNQIAHPYHGSLFYNSFRTNGYSFWQAAPATFAGSYLWETFGENDNPAINDLINTGFGGTVLGEMEYRLSNKIINNQQDGIKRQAQELLGFLIDPTNGLNRLLDGKWGRVRGNTLEKDSSKVSAEFDLGARKFNVNGPAFADVKKFGWYARASLLYGTPYEDYRTPFSNISITLELGKDDSTALNTISVYGSLYGWELRTNDSVKHLLTISANYDYLHNSAFFYGSESVKFNLFSEFKIDKDLKFNTALGAGTILLAAIPDPYLPQPKDYDYGPGVSFNISAGVTLYDRLYYSASYSSALTETFNGNASHYFLHSTTSDLSLILVKGLSLAAEVGYLSLNGHYDHYPEVKNSYPFVRTSVRYSVNF